MSAWALLPASLALSWWAGDTVAVPVTITTGGAPMPLPGTLDVTLTPDPPAGATLDAVVTDADAGALRLDVSREWPAGYAARFTVTHDNGGTRRTILAGTATPADADA